MRLINITSVVVKAFISQWKEELQEHLGRHTLLVLFFLKGSNKNSCIKSHLINVPEVLNKLGQKWKISDY